MQLFLINKFSSEKAKVILPEIRELRFRKKVVYGTKDEPLKISAQYDLKWLRLAHITSNSQICVPFNKW